MGIKPFYVSQIADPMTDDERARWFDACAKEAKAQGARHGRFSVHPVYGWLLVEAWSCRSYELGPDGEGEPRWLMSASK